MPTFVTHTPQDGSEYGSARSVASLNFPWWPVETGVYHAATQLPDGRLSLIVDPGAWTNLMGSTLARKLATKATANGHKPTQAKLDDPLKIRGVGNGSQACIWKMVCPIATPLLEGASVVNNFITPIVEGSGSELPGLFGLRSMETHRALLDTHNRQVHPPGPGEVKIILPPGSVTHPLEKARSGHLLLVVNDFQNLAQKKGGL